MSSKGVGREDESSGEELALSSHLTGTCSCCATDELAGGQWTQENGRMLWGSQGGS